MFQTFIIRHLSFIAVFLKDFTYLMCYCWFITEDCLLCWSSMQLRIYSFHDFFKVLPTPSKYRKWKQSLTICTHAAKSFKRKSLGRTNDQQFKHFVAHLELQIRLFLRRFPRMMTFLVASCWSLVKSSFSEFLLRTIEFALIPDRPIVPVYRKTLNRLTDCSSYFSSFSKQW